MKSYVIAMICFLNLFIFTSQALAHAVEALQIKDKNVTILEFVYSTGDRAVYCLVEVYAPDNDKIEFQNGRTDAEGRFAFVPNQTGVWKAIMSDNVGHKCEVPITVSSIEPAAEISQNATQVNTSPLATMPMWLKAMLGISLLLNIFIGLFLYTQRRNHAH